MTLSPFEVERQEFGRSMMGYKRKEVDSFLDEVRNTLVGLWQERAELREETERLTERVARFTALEEQLKNTLLLAQDSAEKATEQARRESELVMREAGQKAREIVHQAHEERQRLERALQELQSAEQEARQRFRALAHTVLTHLDESDANTAEQATTLRAVTEGAQRPVRRDTPRDAGRDVPKFGTPPQFDATQFTPARPRPEAGRQPSEEQPGSPVSTSTPESRPAQSGDAAPSAESGTREPVGAGS